MISRQCNIIIENCSFYIMVLIDVIVETTLSIIASISELTISVPIIYMPINYVSIIISITTKLRTIVRNNYNILIITQLRIKLLNYKSGKNPP